MNALPRTAIALALLALAAGAHAAADNYNEATNAYKNDLKAKEPDLVKSGFYANHAVSVAKRNVKMADIEGSIASIDTGASGRGGSEVNVASPQILGTVRGDVIVVMQKGAVKGSITSVSR